MKISLNSLLRAGAAVTLCTLALSACDPAVGPDAATLLPKNNLAVRMANYPVDAFGTRATVNNFTTLVSVSENTSAYAGMSRVARLEASVESGCLSCPDSTTYITIFDNGDLGVYKHFDNMGPLRPGNRWVTFPIGLKGATTTVKGDTTIGATRTVETWTSRFLGPEVIDSIMILPAQTPTDMAALKAEFIQRVDFTTNGQTSSSTHTHTIWYSPKLATIVRWQTITTTPGSGGPVGGGREAKIMSYSAE